MAETFEPLLREHRAALHHQLEDRVRGLTAGLKPGDSIPSERELRDAFGVSRTTVRTAIGRLVAEGVLQRDHGRGTFVAEAKVQQGLVATRSFSMGVTASGARPSSRLLERALLDAPADVASDLGIEVGTPVIYLERLRLVDDKPLILDRAYFRREFEALLHADVEHQSVWELIGAVYGVRAERAHETIEITSLGPEEAGLLDDKTGAASFHIHLITFDANGVPIERVHSVCRATTRFQLEMRTAEGERSSEDASAPPKSVLWAAMSRRGGAPVDTKAAPSSPPDGASMTRRA